MNKTYVIRKIAYHYNDEHLYIHTLGGIENTFNSVEEAKKELIKLEREKLENCDLADTAQLSGCNNNYLKEALAFKNYYRQKFGVDIVKVNEHNTVYCDRETRISKGLSDDEIFEIRSILKLNFYELSSFDGSPVFYGIWLNEKSRFKEFGGAPYFYNSYSEALKMAKESLSFACKTIIGTLEELSDTPNFLKSLVNSSENLQYDEEKKVLTATWPTNDESIALNELLKVKVFEIREIPISLVEEIEHWTYEQM